MRAGSSAETSAPFAGTDYSGVVDAALRELLEAGKRDTAIRELILETEAKLAERKLARKAKPVEAGSNRGRGGGGRGRGRMSSEQQRIEDALKAKLARLRDGTFRFPGEPPVDTPPRLSDSEAAAAVRQNAQHHAAPASLPRGQPSGSRGGGEHDEDDDCAEDDEEDPQFKQYYRVPARQKAFNRQAAREWHESEARRARPTILPPDVLRGGCQPESLGLGVCHVHSPRKDLGLPHPPCPHGHGWRAVDLGKVRTNGRCPARRVYADETDEWVVGDKMICGLCLDIHEEKQERLDELRECAKGGLDVDEEIEEAEAELKAAHYSYRSYDSRSMKLYAERYAW